MYKPDYTYVDRIAWGKGKGCNFVEKACYATEVASFPEFNQQANGCIFEYSGWGYSYKPGWKDGCAIGGVYSNTNCLKDGGPFFNYHRNAFGHDVKCFNAEIAPTGKGASYSVRCLKYRC